MKSQTGKCGKIQESKRQMKKATVMEPARGYRHCPCVTLHRKIEVTQRNALQAIGDNRDRENADRKLGECKIETVSRSWKRVNPTWLFPIFNSNNNKVLEHIKKLDTIHEKH